ncbi:unnamed protein product [Parascedosporium putredinis]|uniref:Arrestin-like N-terminal domain-containing protein n=1 Tax=Parascedosporium putredinis TaxID=1442378 RepID=A0A9P1M5V9_9PEZI|nr:unnamed protein product [Parascedosporium putredinis]CAI7987715.1 unnamed protein product [Parascedosporium putredinis]
MYCCAPILACFTLVKRKRAFLETRDEQDLYLGLPITGDVIINPLRDTRFENVEITFIGLSRTKVMATQVAQRSSHVFLKLTMPVSDSKYPVPRIFEQGRCYTIPFNFVEHHMRLLPSMGGWSRDDFAPETAEIEYYVRARVLGEADAGHRPDKIFEAQKSLLVLPASPEDAPYDITSKDVHYTMTKTKSIRKGMFSHKLGRFTASASQPPAIHLSADTRSASDTAVTLQLAFEPSASDIAPPPSTDPTSLLSPRIAYKTSLALFNTNVDRVTWRLRGAAVRRDSGYSSDPADSDGNSSKKQAAQDKTAHLATLYIPFDVPAKQRVLLPTFHSCLVSRTYALHLTLTVGPTNTTVSLVIPVQIAVEPSDESIVLDDEAIAEDVDEYLTPRVIRVPDQEPVQHILPGYA